MGSEISETTATVSEQNGLEHFSKAKFRVKRVSEISEAIGPESQTAHDLPDNLQNLHLPFLSNNLVSEISETSLNQNYGFIKFPEKTKMYKTHKKENCWKNGCNQQWMRIYQVKTKISLQSSQVSYQITKHANNNHTSAQK